MSETEWKDIGSAPKDGTFILLAGGSTDEDLGDDEKAPAITSRPVTGFWYEWRGMGRWCFACWDMGWRSEYYRPTHWMPLPPAPNAGE